ncbi:hypothetical protein [Gemmobacter sp. 24YEA27]|uniref:hypothetical protein n=1 Tax=Gemmobacter sp. 24YEA27 TaxID=3040672 RepID=UPI0024B37D24|nr:hypothetical protein [Gemmobacter sp. 24YEA27]
MPPAVRIRCPILGIWIAMIVTGSVAVFWYTARRIRRPIGQREDSAGRVGTDASLPLVPDAGPAEMRATTPAFNQVLSRLART